MADKKDKYVNLDMNEHELINSQVEENAGVTSFDGHESRSTTERFVQLDGVKKSYAFKDEIVNDLETKEAQSAYDWDTVTSPGVYHGNGSTTNRPTAFNGFERVLVYGEADGNPVTQISIDGDGTALAFRRLSGAAWSDWVVYEGYQEPFQVSNTTDLATTNTQDIYTQGSLGIKTSVTPLEELDVNGGAYIGLQRTSSALLQKEPDILNATGAFTQNNTTTTNGPSVARFISSGISGNKWNTALDIKINQQVAGAGSSPQIEFRTNSGGTHSFNATPLTLFTNTINAFNAKLGAIFSTAWATFSHHTIPSAGSDYALAQDTNGRTLLNAAANQLLEFRKGNVTQMSINAANNVGIGTNAPNAKFTVNGTATKPGGGTWGTFSDVRLKEESSIKSFFYGLDAVKKIRTVFYKYKEGNELEIPSEKTHIGIIAQELEEIIPEAVEGENFKTVNVDAIIMALVNAVQELSEKVDRLEKR